MKLYNKSFVIIALAALMTQNAIAQSKQNTATNKKTQRKYNQQYAKAIRDTKNWILVTPKAPLTDTANLDRKPLRNTPSPKANLEAEIDREIEEMWKRYDDFFNKAENNNDTQFNKNATQSDSLFNEFKKGQSSLEAEIDREKEEMWKKYKDFFNKAQKEQNTFREVIIIYEKTK